MRKQPSKARIEVMRNGVLIIKSIRQRKNNAVCIVNLGKGEQCFPYKRKGGRVKRQGKGTTLFNGARVVLPGGEVIANTGGTIQVI